MGSENASDQIKEKKRGMEMLRHTHLFTGLFLRY